VRLAFILKIDILKMHVVAFSKGIFMPRKKKDENEPERGQEKKPVSTKKRKGKPPLSLFL
jgi:hypothetical protein